MHFSYIYIPYHTLAYNHLPSEASKRPQVRFLKLPHVSPNMIWNQSMLLIEEILHQLILWISHCWSGFIYIYNRWLAGFPSTINDRSVKNVKMWRSSCQSQHLGHHHRDEMENLRWISSCWYLRIFFTHHTCVFQTQDLKRNLLLQKVRQNTIDGSEIPNNHLGWW